MGHMKRPGVLNRYERYASAGILIGLAILFCALSLNQWLGGQRSVVANVFAEGLIVAAWVSLWEAVATFLIERFPHRKNVALYRRLAAAGLLFRVG